MPLLGFEPTISAGERTQTYALDRAVAETGVRDFTCPKKKKNQLGFDVK
jgi:hypothetical protein